MLNLRKYINFQIRNAIRDSCKTSVLWAVSQNRATPGGICVLVSEWHKLTVSFIQNRGGCLKRGLGACLPNVLANEWHVRSSANNQGGALIEAGCLFAKTFKGQ